MSTPPDPLRERLKTALLARLSTIVAGSFYWATPSAVVRDIVEVDQYDAELRTGPVLGLARSSGSTIDVSMDRDPTYEHALVVDLVGYVRGDTSATADTRLERAWQDVFACLMADQKLGGLAMDLRPVGEMETDRGLWEPEAFFRQPWRVRATESPAP